MSLMRHTDLRLTMKLYTDPRIFDLAGAVEKLPINLGTAEDSANAVKATETDDKLVEQTDNKGANEVVTATLGRHSMGKTSVEQGSGESQVEETAQIGNKKLHPAGWSERAGDGSRTHDVQLGKLTFYH